MATANYWDTSHACPCGAALRYNGATGRYYCRACGRKLTRDELAKGRDSVGRMHEFLKGLDAHIEREDEPDEPDGKGGQGMRQAVSNSCYDDGSESRIWGTHEDCGGYAPDGKPCACECHQMEAFDMADGGQSWRVKADAAPVCDKCGALLSVVEAAGRATGTCNECLRDKEAFPRVGDGATLCLWSDRQAATVVYVSPSFKTIRIQLDIAKLTSGDITRYPQSYDYTPNPDARIITATRRHDGKFRVANGTERVLIGVRAEYRDPHF